MIWCVCADEQSSVNQPWPKGFYQLNSLTSNKRLMLSLVWFGPWCLFIRCSLFTEVQSEQFCSFPASHAVTSRYLLLGLGCEEPVVHILACEKHWVVSLWLDLLLAAKRSCIQQFMQSSQKLIMQNYQKKKTQENLQWSSDNPFCESNLHAGRWNLNCNSSSHWAQFFFLQWQTLTPTPLSPTPLSPIVRGRTVF